MGFHSFLQARGLPFEGAMAKSWNMKMFKHIKAQADEASMALAVERGPCPDAHDRGVMERFSCKMAIAPTASISIICGGTSACIEPIPANIYTHKTLSGSVSVKNPYLEKIFIEKSKNSDAVWSSILEHGGSVQHLDFLSQEEKDCYKTSFEIDQRWLIELQADRTPFVDQSTSLNLFIRADVEKWDLLMLHFRAWELGVKSLYYLRSKSVQRAGFVGRGRGRQHDRGAQVRAGRDDGLRRMPGLPVSVWESEERPEGIAPYETKPPARSHGHGARCDCAELRAPVASRVTPKPFRTPMAASGAHRPVSCGHPDRLSQSW